MIRQNTTEDWTEFINAIHNQPKGFTRSRPFSFDGMKYTIIVVHALEDDQVRFILRDRKTNLILEDEETTINRNVDNSGIYEDAVEKLVFAAVVRSLF